VVFHLETPKGEILTVVATSTIPSRLGSPIIKKDDRVIVLGKRKNETIQAFGVRKVDKQFEIFQRRPHNPIPRMK